MKPTRHSRHAMTLLELMIATAMMATVMTALATLVRSTYAAWQTHEGDLAVLESAHATVRHIVRQTRQAVGVAAVSDPATTSGSLTLLMSDGSSLVWEHDNANAQVLHGVTTASSLLAQDIDQLQFTGYEADGTTATTVVADMHAVKCSATVSMPSGSNRTISCFAWIRSW